MPQFSSLVRHSLLLARANNSDSNNDDDDDNGLIINDDYDNNTDRNHRRLEVGVIIAIVVAGLAVIVVIFKLIMKLRKRQAKRAAKQPEEEITWYGPEDEPWRVSRWSQAIGVALGGQEGVAVGGKATKKVTFAQEREAPPPSYELVVSSKPQLSSIVETTESK